MILGGNDISLLARFRRTIGAAAYWTLWYDNSRLWSNVMMSYYSNRNSTGRSSSLGQFIG